MFLGEEPSSKFCQGGSLKILIQSSLTAAVELSSLKSMANKTRTYRVISTDLLLKVPIVSYANINTVQSRVEMEVISNLTLSSKSKCKDLWMLLGD